MWRPSIFQRVGRFVLQIIICKLAGYKCSSLQVMICKLADYECLSLQIIICKLADYNCSLSGRDKYYLYYMYYL